MTPVPPTRRLRRLARFALVGLLLAGTPALADAQRAGGAPPDTRVGPDGAVLFLVRHAEKAAEPAADPPLTPDGRSRATLLATLLDDADLDAVWSTDYERTRSTAGAAAEREGLRVELYDPRDLTAFAATLRQRGGRALVVGHSNTTPALVEALGGDPGLPIDEAGEYDRLYVLTILSGEVVTTLLRYGPPFPGG